MQGGGVAFVAVGHDGDEDPVPPALLIGQAVVGRAVFSSGGGVGDKGGDAWAFLEYLHLEIQPVEQARQGEADMAAADQAGGEFPAGVDGKSSRRQRSTRDRLLPGAPGRGCQKPTTTVCWPPQIMPEALLSMA